MIFKNKNNNKIILHKKNGQSVQVSHVNGLSIRFKGKNSVVEVWEPISFKCRFGNNRCKIRIGGDNNIIKIKSSKYMIASIQIVGLKNNNTVTIGENLYASGLSRFEFANSSNLHLTIGRDCMFGQNVRFLLGDYHAIYDTETMEQINLPTSGIELGEHVWIARDVTVMKDVIISSNSVVGIKSLVTKSFIKENVLIGGQPAKILQENITWAK